MNETLAHALRLCDLLALDLARLGDEVEDAETLRLLAECVTSRLALANRLRFIRDTPSVGVTG